MKNNRGYHTVRGYQLLAQQDRDLTSAMEDYLEMIYRYSIDDGFLRINNLASLLNVQASSATKMVQKLGTQGLLAYEKYGVIILTEKGKKIGRFLLERHKIIENFLKFLGVEENILVETELIEHNISGDTLALIDLLNRFIQMYPEFKKEFEAFKSSETV